MEGEGNPEQDSHWVMARGGAQKPCQKSTHTHFPHFLVRNNAFIYREKRNKNIHLGHCGNSVPLEKETGREKKSLILEEKSARSSRPTSTKAKERLDIREK